MKWAFSTFLPFIALFGRAFFSVSLFFHKLYGYRLPSGRWRFGFPPGHAGLGTVLALLVLFATLPAPAAADGCLTPPGDITASGITNVADVQCEILVVLAELSTPGGPPPSCALVPASALDTDCDGARSVSDIVLIISYGLQSPLSAQIDTNANLCPDACETQCAGKPDGAACDADSSGCTKGDHCLSGTCVPGSAPNCGDGLTCTDNLCTSTGPTSFICSNPIKAAQCLIDGECYALAAPNPASPCLVCAPATNPTAWSNAASGTACDADSNGCTAGDSCQAGLCTAGPVPDCNDSFSCTADACTSTGASAFSCTHVVLNKTCLISGVCYAANAINPQNPCQICKSATSKTAWTPAADGTLCNADNSGCTQNDSCLAGACLVGAAPNCSDGKGCTVDTCISGGPSAYSCTHGIESTKCLIDGDCKNNGADNPDNPCETCKTGVSQTAWSAKNNGVSCDADNNGCTQNDACSSGVCIAGAPPSCGDGKACTTDACTSTGAATFVCTNTVNAGKCLIDTVCYSDTVPNPVNACQECTPTLSATAWSNKPNGSTCDLPGGTCTLDTCSGGACTASSPVNCNDGKTCTTDSCNGATGACTNTIQNGFCVIDGVCIPNNTVDPQNPCQICKSAQNKTAWSQQNNGTACNADNNGCTVGDACNGGLCVAGAAAVCDDALACTTDTCTSSGDTAFVCNHTVLNGKCAVSGACYDAGATDPENSCRRCTPSQNKTAFSNKTDGTTCDADASGCTTDDACQAGVCTAGAPAPCDDGVICTLDTCTATGSTGYACAHTVAAGTCLISGTCYAGQATNPLDPCEQCKPGLTKTAWSNAPDGSSCDSDGNGCTENDACQAGVCAPGPAVLCSDGKGCTNDLCTSTGAFAYTCTHTLSSGKCLIFGGCYKAGDENPDNPCQACRPTLSTSSYSPKNDGVLCEKDKSVCTQDACQSGACTTAAVESCDDGFPCTLDVCDPITGACSHAPQSGSCFVDGACWDAKVTNPQNPCQICKPGASTTAWSNAADGTGCDADGSGCTVGDACQSGDCQAGAAQSCNDKKACTTDACVSTGPDSYSCFNTLDTSKCLIDGVCINGGADNPDNNCQRCHTATSTTAWSAKTNGTACDADNNGCTAGDTCQGGTCTGGPAPNCDDGKTCTTDGCSSTGATTFVCNNTTKAGKCLIAGVCWSDSDLNPQNPCHECAPDVTKTAWSNKPNGTACDLPGGNCTVDSCAAGVCTVSSPVNCDDGKTCTNDSCNTTTGACTHTVQNGFCLIDGACVAGQAIDPKNPCQACKPATNKTAWTAAANGTACDADGNGCTAGDACAGGICTAGAPAVCNDGLGCTTDACTSTGATTFSCTVSVQNGFCAVSGACYAANSQNPANPCQKCAPSQTKTAFSNRADGQGCNADNNGCTQDDACLAGICTAGAPPSCTDGISCTDDLCQSTGNTSYTCTHPLKAARCLIGGACYTDGEENPDNECQHCKAQTSTAVFTNKGASAACEADLDPCTDLDHCDSGACVASAPSTCDDTNACTIDSCIPFLGCHHEPVAVFVNAANTQGPADGKSWATAWPTIEQGLNAATAGDRIFVAAGAYFQHKEQNEPSAGQSADPVIKMKSGVDIYGGFLGTECAPELRPTPLPVSLISADRNKDGVYNPSVFPLYNGDTRVPVTGASDAVLDGFVIGGGGGPGGTLPYHGAVALEASFVDNLTLRNCLFVSNNMLTEKNVTNSNWASPVAIYFATNLTMDRCEFLANSTAAVGVPLYLHGSDNVTIRDSLFMENETLGQKLAISTYGVTGLVVSDTRFIANTTASTATTSLIYINNTPGALFRNCTFLDNSTAAATAYAVMVSVSGESALIGCSALFDQPSWKLLRTEGSNLVQVDSCAIFGSTGAPFTKYAGLDPLFKNTCYSGSALVGAASGPGNVLLGESDNPFVIDGYRLFLRHAGLDGAVSTTPCVDAGDTAAAAVAGWDVAALTTRTDGVLDTAPADAGAHYHRCDAPNSVTCDDIEVCVFDGDCDDGVSCTVDACVTMGEGVNGCAHTVADDSCRIGGTCYASGALSSSNPCMACNPTVDQGGFTALTDGTACGAGTSACAPKICKASVCVTGNSCDDKISCTTDTCTNGANGTFSCSYGVANGMCFVNNVCYTAGTKDPQNVCKECKPTTTKTAFSNSNNNTTCEGDGDVCTIGAKCSSGVCGAPTGLLDCNDQSACTEEICVPFVGCQYSPTAIFVDDSGTAVTPDGKTWATAYPTITQAMTAAQSGDILYVAEGVYYGSIETFSSGYDLSYGALEPKSGVSVYGGFLPGQCAPDERSNPLPASKLTSDLNQDGVFTNGVDSAHTIRVNYREDVVIDGFVLGFGGPGGTLPYSPRSHCAVSNSSNVTVRNCSMSNAMNLAVAANPGAAVDVYNTDTVTISNCVFHSNSTLRRGGAVGITSSNNATVSECVFSDNIAETGGAVAILSSDNTLLSDNTFLNNESSGDLFNGGGALLLVNSDNSAVVNSTFMDNVSGGDGGAINIATSLGAVVSGCSFKGSVGPGVAGHDVHVYGNINAFVRNCAFFQADPSANSLATEQNGTITVASCCGPNLGSFGSGNGNVVLGTTADPFVVKGQRLYLRHAGLDGVTTSTPCVDAGSDALATADGIPWAQQTTRSDGVLDTSPVDMGARYTSLCAGVAEGGACDDLDPCTVGETCQGGTCKSVVTTNCGDGLGCTVDTCVPVGGAMFSCVHTLKAQRCLIGGVCYQEGDLNPEADCEVCSAESAQTAWSLQIDGALCHTDGSGCTVDTCVGGVCAAGFNTACEDGLSCTTNTCSSADPVVFQCSTTVQNGNCALDGACYSQNEHNPANDCEFCKPATSKTMWTPRGENLPCEGDGQFCVSGELCTGGICLGGMPVDCDDNNPCTMDSCAPSAGCIHEGVAIFVDDSAAGPTQDGQTWGTAYKSIASAMAAAASGDEIWVAKGMYWAPAVGQNLLEMKAGVGLYGGFVGTECVRDDRPLPLEVSRLSGDTDKNGQSSSNDALYLVVAASDTVIDGFYFGGLGGPDGSSPYYGRYGLGADGVTALTVRNNVFESNGYNVGLGAAALVEDSADVLFAKNTFKNNVSANGPGIHGSLTQGLEIRECVFENNDSSSSAGAVFLSRTDGAVVRDCLFDSNSAVSTLQVYGGAIRVSQAQDVLIANSTFVNNTTNGSGGAVALSSTFASFPTSGSIVGCSFSGNQAAFGGAVYVGSYATVEVANAAAFGNGATASAGAAELYADPTVTGAGTLSVHHSCTPVTIAGQGNVKLNPNTENPFVQVGSRLYLQQPGTQGSTFTTECVDAGSSASAKAAGISWKKWTTRSDGGLDAVPIDMGVHYPSCAGVVNGVTCDDTDPCTVNDVCADGECGGGPKNCDDGDGFTIDTCGDGGICQHVPDCDDGDPCTVDTGEDGECYHQSVAIFVDAAAVGPTFDGTSWQTAFKKVSDAVFVAAPGDSIWVAEGTYKASGAQGTVLQMKMGVSVYGGFQGTECQIALRPTPLGATILDGDYDGNGVASPKDSKHVVIAASETTLDGVTLKRGANFGMSDDGAAGAGLFVSGIKDFTARNLMIVDNYTEQALAAGVLIDDSQNIVVEDCEVKNNTTNTAGLQKGGAGGVLIQESNDVVVRGVVFAYNEGYEAGAVMLKDTVSTAIEDCIFRGNRGSTKGAGVTLGYAATYTAIRNTSFYDNDALGLGGAISAVYAWYDIDVVGCSFYGNAAQQGGAIYAQGSQVVVTNSVFFGNTTTLGTASEVVVSTANNSSVDVSYSCLPVATAGVGNLQLSPTTGNPYTVFGSRLFLKHAGVAGETTTTVCANAGSATQAAGILWAEKTTRKDGALDTAPIDMGVHYEP